MLKASLIVTLFYLVYTTEAYTYHNMIMLNRNLTAHINPPVEQKLSIFFLTVMPPIGILLYMPLLYLIITRRKKYNNPFYKLVLAVSLNDHVLLLHFIYMGVCI